jgi:hypothetical protein
MSKKSLTASEMLSEMHKDIKEIKETLIPNLRTELAVLKVKNTMWSALTGVMGGFLAAFTLKWTR